MQEYITLLKTLISTPSISREEDQAAMVVREFLHDRKIAYSSRRNNTWCLNRFYDPVKPVILLNSHIDTVKPVPGWNNDPFTPVDDGARITGLGSNDAGGSVVALLALFLHYYDKNDLPFNLVYSATAEEEVSGENGIVSILSDLPPIRFAVVGEPTEMEMAIAEKGLMVLDCTAKGKAGHAAREVGENALYKALDDIEKLRNFRFEKDSELLGPVKITVTQIKAGTQHNVIPDSCHFVVDVRTNEFYRNEEAFQIISTLLDSEVIARSFRLNSSGIPADHPFALKAVTLGIPLTGSPTTSDQAVIPGPSVKIGPGNSHRSHTAHEYILKNEVFEGIQTYIKLFEDLYL
jgi:acetylornithine deacetylase